MLYKFFLSHQWIKRYMYMWYFGRFWWNGAKFGNDVKALWGCRVSIQIHIRVDGLDPKMSLFSPWTTQHCARDFISSKTRDKKRREREKKDSESFLNSQIHRSSLSVPISPPRETFPHKRAREKGREFSLLSEFCEIVARVGGRVESLSPIPISFFQWITVKDSSGILSSPHCVLCTLRVDQRPNVWTRTRQ